ncbi:hypothetical protein LUZ60_012525 [Juncus effusus]|nr:hypothetical protein LUZ60_012525 [Juncus effusus]
MAEPAEVCTFIRKSTSNKNIRKRKTHNSSSSSDDEQQSTKSRLPPKTIRRDNKLVFSSSTSRRAGKADEAEEEDEAVFKFESSSAIQVENDSRATAVLETETEYDKDARAIRERVLKQAEASLKGKSKGGEEEKLYRGLNGYKDYKAGFRREHTVAGEKASGAHGPLRASAHIRLSARFDYQPDICKDYKETGYCGYGDSCKFMHDRGDYKSGWQMEKEWDEAEKERKRKLALREFGEEDEDEESDEEGEDELPFACYICREKFVDPVVTKCKHYFCEHCALKHHSKNKKCFVCNKPTLGIFNVAQEIKKRMAQEK